MPYYNTLSESGSDLKQSIKQTEKQDKKIMDFFLANPYKNFTPFEVMRGAGFNPMQKFSVARSINTLTKQGKLIMLPKKFMRMGEMGKKNHVWTLKVDYIQKELF